MNPPCVLVRIIRFDIANLNVALPDGVMWLTCRRIFVGGCSECCHQRMYLELECVMINANGSKLLLGQVGQISLNSGRLVFVQSDFLLSTMVRHNSTTHLENMFFFLLALNKQIRESTMPIHCWVGFLPSIMGCFCSNISNG